MKTMMPQTSRLIAHALPVADRMTPGRRTLFRSWAEDYLAQVEGRLLPTWPLHSDAANRRDAFVMHGGATMSSLLGLSVDPSGVEFPCVVRAVLARWDAPVVELAAVAVATGQPQTVVLAHVFGIRLSVAEMAVAS